MAPMPSALAAPSTPSSLPAPATPAQAHASPAQQLAQAHRALWVATLSLMTAFMQTQAPAHRYLIARRIGRNLATLSQPNDCFDHRCRTTFARLARRWSDKAEEFAPEPANERKGVPGFLL
jgi:hypothetical protein